jgi:DNA-nicking Smr family endonuclease
MLTGCTGRIKRSAVSAGDLSSDDDGAITTVDLHGLSVERALRRVMQELHAARVRRLSRMLVITGAGWGNPDRRPVLREGVERWLRSPEARSLGVLDVQRVHKGGALDVRLG